MVLIPEREYIFLVSKRPGKLWSTEPSSQWIFWVFSGWVQWPWY